MTRLIITTSKRGAPSNMISGNLFVIDLENRRLLRRTEGIDPAYREFDVNPGGGMRGLRGISFHGNEIAMANYSSVFVFDTQWRLLRTVTHPLCAAIHEVWLDAHSLWVTSTVNDELQRFDLDGRLKERISVHMQPEVARIPGVRRISAFPSGANTDLDFRDPRKYNTEEYDHTHINSICRAGDREMLVSLGLITSADFSLLMSVKTLLIKSGIWKHVIRINQMLRRMLNQEKKMLTELIYQPARWRSAVLRVDKQNNWRLLFMVDGVVNPSHTVRMLRSGTGLYLNTSQGKLIEFDPDSGEVLASSFVSEKFLRGAVELSDRKLAVGAGNELVIFDLKSRQVVDKIILSDDPSEAVHGLDILPDEFDLPPASLANHLGSIIGFDGDKVLWGEERSPSPSVE